MWWGTAGEAPRGNDASTASLKSRTENSLLEQARSVFYSLRHRNVRIAIASCEEACTKGPMLIPTFVTVRVHANRERLGTRCIHVRWHGGRCCYGALFYRSQQAVRFFAGKLLCIHERVQFIPALTQGIGADLITDLTHV